jgi:hypothetical protein
MFRLPHVLKTTLHPTQAIFGFLSFSPTWLPLANWHVRLKPGWHMAHLDGFAIFGGIVFLVVST